MCLPSTSGLPAVEFPPLEFDHYSSAPEIMVLKNTGPQKVDFITSVLCPWYDVFGQVMWWS